ncbi:MAG: flavodoxin family protein [Bacteroidales bacterium]|nr:flavodoxin family protein [Bacteroidales bacterium]
MKVIGINGSSRKDGNTAIIIGKVFDKLTNEGIETELIQLADYDIQPCRGCFACKGRGNCVFTNDGFSEIFSRVVNTDGLLLGSPVYSADVTAKMKAFLERGGVVVATNPGLLRHKVGASVAAVRRGGGMTAVDTMNHFMLNKEMIIVGSTYWNMVYGKNIGDVLNDDEGMANIMNLGHNMAWLLHKLNDNLPE